MTPEQLTAMQLAAQKRINEYVNRAAPAVLREWRKRWKGTK